MQFSRKRLDWASGLQLVLFGFALLGGKSEWSSSEVDWGDAASVGFAAVMACVTILLLWSFFAVWLNGFRYLKWRYRSGGVIVHAAFLLLTLVTMPWGPVALYFLVYRNDGEYRGN